MKKDNAFKLEWQNTLQILAKKNSSFKEFNYFLNLGEEYANLYSESNNEAKVVMIGTTFPEEIIRAMNLDFCYIFGGSYESTIYKNVNLPKDVDDITKSIVGILKNESLNLNKKDVLIIPYHSDSMKKIGSLFVDSTNVICYELPIDKNDELQSKRFIYEINRVIDELGNHFKRKLSLSRLKEECMISKDAAKVFNDFELLFKERTSTLSGSAFIYIANTYHFCKNKIEWTNHLKALIDELKDNKESKNENPEIMLFGSPIYAPNFKILFAIEDVKLKPHTIVHPDIAHIKVAKYIDTNKVDVKSLTMRYLKSDISSAYINNDTMIDLIMNTVKDSDITGIIVHIIKGQIEYDYVFRCIEGKLSKTKIPLNRIETVYGYQDIEQLRLRLDAFSEILSMPNEH